MMDSVATSNIPLFYTLMEKGSYTPEWGIFLAIINILSACRV